MLSITQVEKTNYRAGHTAKHVKTPDVKELGAVHRTILPSHALETESKLSKEQIEKIVIDEATQLTCRMALLGKEFHCEKQQQPTEIPDDAISSLIAHSLPLEKNDAMRHTLVNETAVESLSENEETDCQPDKLPLTCHSDNSCLLDSHPWVHDWSGDTLQQSEHVLCGRLHVAASLVHPCCRGTVAVPMQFSAPRPPPPAPKLASVAPSKRSAPMATFSALDLQNAAASLLKIHPSEVGKRVLSKEEALKRDLVKKLSEIQSKMSQTGETMDERIEKQRLEREKLRAKTQREDFARLFRLKNATGSETNSNSNEFSYTSSESESRTDSQTNSSDEATHFVDRCEYSYSYTEDDHESCSEKSKELDSDYDVAKLFNQKFSDYFGEDSSECAYLKPETSSFLFTYIPETQQAVEDVKIAGTFNHWSIENAVSLRNVGTDQAVFLALLELPIGYYEYKFIVDGKWVLCPSKPFVVLDNGVCNHYCKVDAEFYEEEGDEESESFQQMQTETKPPNFLKLNGVNSELEDKEIDCSSLPLPENLRKTPVEFRRMSFPDKVREETPIDFENIKKEMDQMQKDVEAAICKWQNMKVASDSSSSNSLSSSSSSYSCSYFPGSKAESYDSYSDYATRNSKNDQETESKTGSSSDDEDESSYSYDYEYISNSNSGSGSNSSEIDSDTHNKNSDSESDEDHSYDMPDLKFEMQSHMNCMIAICNANDTFMTFKQLNCPFVLQWADSTHSRIHIFRRNYTKRYNWAMQKNKTVYFQLLATVAALVE